MTNTENQVENLKNEIKNAKNQYNISDIVAKFDDPCNLDTADDIYSESDMEDNMEMYDDYGNPEQAKKDGISKNTLKQDKQTLDRLNNDNYPTGFDLYFHEDGTPVSLDEMKEDALDLLDQNF